jgi:membrane associated rhomboid family serine protease
MTPWVLRLIIANVAMFFIQNMVDRAVLVRLVLIPEIFPQQPWTLISYMFLHGDTMHLLFNMLSLFFFGPRVELRLGSRHFLGLYLASGIMGGILSIVFTPHVGGVIGASGASFGVTLAFARYWPRDPVFFWGIPVEARLMVIIMTALSLFGARSGAGGIAHFAHLGGFLGGYLYLRWCEIRSPARDFKKRAVQEPRRRVSGSNHTADLQRWSRIPRESMHEVNRTEVDRILAKINASGIGSLTPGERETLERFSPKA